MLKPLFLTCAVMVGSATLAGAETIDIQMLNRGVDGAMVFEPSYVLAAPGDVIHFVSVDRGHNVESIEGMLPDGVAPFKSAMSEDFDLTVEAEGLFGIKCTPHYALGMVALIQVGAAVNLDGAAAVTHRGKAATRFEAAFALVQ
jgi:pseudoazurin